MKKPSNNFAFIDSQNLNLAIRDQGWILDWRKFRVYLREKYQVNGAYLFLGFMPENEKLYKFLKYVGYKLIFKPVVQNKMNEVKGNIDAELVLHTMIQYNNYDQAVIVTGDGDFYCLVEYLRNQKKLLTLLVPNMHKYSGLLKRAAAKSIVFCNDLQLKMSYIKRTP